MRFYSEFRKIETIILPIIESNQTLDNEFNLLVFIEITLDSSGILPPFIY
jgi:hypothetical protein